MNLVGIEVVNMDTGTIRAVECRCGKGNFKIKNAVMASFGRPFLKITPKDMTNCLRDNRIRGRAVMIIMPEETHRSVLWEHSGPESELKTRIPAIIDENRDELEVGKTTVVKSSITGRHEDTCYGITAAAESEVLEGFYRVFKGYDIKYLLPKMTAYSLIHYAEDPEEVVGLMDIRNESLSMVVYRHDIMTWRVTLPLSNRGGDKTGSICQAALKAANTARSSRMYLTRIILSGECADGEGIEDALSAALELPCEKPGYAQDGMNASAALTTLLSVTRGLLR